MSFEETLRTIVREEVRAALRDHGASATSEPAPELVALGDVKRWVQVSKSTLKEWIRTGKLTRYGEGRIVRVRLDDVRAVLRGRAAATPAASNAGADVQRILASLPGGRR